MNRRFFSFDDLLLLVLGAFAAACGAALEDASHQLHNHPLQPAQALSAPAPART